MGKPKSQGIPDVITLPDTEEWEGRAEEVRQRDRDWIKRVGALGKPAPSKPVPAPPRPKHTVEELVRGFGEIRQVDLTNRKDRARVQTALADLYRKSWQDAYIVSEKQSDLTLVSVPGPNDPSGSVLRAWAAAINRVYGTRPPIRLPQQPGAPGVHEEPRT